MYRELQRRLRGLSSLGSAEALTRGLKGIEKESLRVTAAGTIARTPHPHALGAALTHPYITTDYSEALLELITPPFEDAAETLRFLRETHQFVHASLADELLWATSMPCAVAGDESIPIASYGTSNSGMMRHVYRRGLAYRYGRVMQVISGVHYNYSIAPPFWPVFRELEGDTRPLGEFVAERYFGLIRNVLRYGWLLVYLFGASPALCRSFLGADAERFQRFDESTRYEPHATSLRMSDIGYTNRSQTRLRVVYDDLSAYVASLTRAIETPYPPYRDIGIKVEGEYRQLNANILQIENEFYSPVRPKQIAERGEKPTLALQRRGVAYVEVRSLDVNPFSEIGIDAQALAVLEAFMLFCLFHDSPPISTEEHRAIDQRVATTARRGREPGIGLVRSGRSIALRDWGLEVVDVMAELASAVGSLGEGTTTALRHMRERLEDPEATPSARMLREMRDERLSFFAYGLALSERHRDALRREPLAVAVREAFEGWAEESHAEQRELEANDDVSFEDYLERYFAGSG